MIFMRRGGFLARYVLARHVLHEKHQLHAYRERITTLVPHVGRLLRQIGVLITDDHHGGPATLTEIWKPSNPAAPNNGLAAIAVSESPSPSGRSAKEKMSRGITRDLVDRIP